MENLTNRSILVTGGAGFIGSHLARALADDNDVRIVDDLSDGRRSRVPEAARFIEGDIRDEATLDRAVDGVDLIFHEAAQVSVEASVEDPLGSHSVNTDATLSLLECARDANARVVLASSAAVYGQPKSVPIAETNAKEPTSPYGIDKLTVDQYARRYADLYGLETVALRYFNVYGPDQDGGDYSGVIEVFLKQARAGDPVTVHGDGEQTRDFVHVSDVVKANLLAATTEHVGEAYNVGTGTSVTIKRLAELIAAKTGSDSPITHIEGRPGDIEHSRADIEKARERLGYDPKVVLEEGIEDLIETRDSADAPERRT